MNSVGVGAETLKCCKSQVETLSDRCLGVIVTQTVMGTGSFRLKRAEAARFWGGSAWRVRPAAPPVWR